MKVPMLIPEVLLALQVLQMQLLSKPLSRLSIHPLVSMTVSICHMYGVYTAQILTHLLLFQQQLQVVLSLLIHKLFDLTLASKPQHRTSAVRERRDSASSFRIKTKVSKMPTVSISGTMVAKI